MFNLRAGLGMDSVKKTDDSQINTSSLRCNTKKSDEDLSAAKIYSTIGSQQSIDKVITNAKQKAVKHEVQDIWAGSMQGLFQ